MTLVEEGPVEAQRSGGRRWVPVYWLSSTPGRWDLLRPAGPYEHGAARARTSRTAHTSTVSCGTWNAACGGWTVVGSSPAADRVSCRLPAGLRALSPRVVDRLPARAGERRQPND